MTVKAAIKNSWRERIFFWPSVGASNLLLIFREFQNALSDDIYSIVCFCCFVNEFVDLFTSSVQFVDVGVDHLSL